MADRYHDIIKGNEGTNAGKDCPVFCEKNFEVNAQLLFFDEVAEKYCPLEIKGTYVLKMREATITTVKGGYINTIKLNREFKRQPKTTSKFYKLNTLR